MTKRTNKHIKYCATLKSLKRNFRKPFINLHTQADFPDSGYFYGKLERKVTVAWERLENFLGTRKALAYYTEILQQARRASYEYHEVVRVVDSTGRGWTAAEMDSEMCRG